MPPNIYPIDERLPQLNFNHQQMISINGSTLGGAMVPHNHKTGCVGEQLRNSNTGQINSNNAATTIKQPVSVQTFPNAATQQFISGAQIFAGLASNGQYIGAYRKDPNLSGFLDIHKMNMAIPGQQQ
jgi:hypothetical protein